MATDAYIKFGECDAKSDYGTPLPAIEGDSTDLWHYWWCELRSCGFDLEATDWKTPSEGTDGEENDDKEKAKAQFRKVTVKKRVDWSSTQLFLLCCQQAKALSDNLDVEEQKKNWIDMITVEICRQTGNMVQLKGENVLEKIPFVTVKYHDARITHYSVDLSGPEPSESVTFEFQKLEFEYQRTHPETGAKITTDGIIRTSELANSTTGQGGATPGGGTVSTTTSAPSGGGSSGTGNGSPSSPNAPGNGAPAAPAFVTDEAGANFPSLLPGAGFGLLPYN